MTSSATLLLILLNILILGLVSMKLTNIKGMILKREQRNEARADQIINLNKVIENLKIENRELITYKRKNENYKRLMNANYGSSSIDNVDVKKDEEIVLPPEDAEKQLKQVKKELYVRETIIKGVIKSLEKAGTDNHEAK